jgi:hypothetical protein
MDSCVEEMFLGMLCGQDGVSESAANFEISAAWVDRAQSCKWKKAGIAEWRACHRRSSEPAKTERGRPSLLSGMCAKDWWMCTRNCS